MTKSALKLDVAYDWRTICLARRLLEPGETVTFGTGPLTTLVAPEGQADHLGRDPWPKRMALVRARRGGHRVRLLPAMTGRLLTGGQTVDIGGLFAVPGKKRFLRKPALHRDVDIAPGDTAEIVIDAVNQLRLSLAYVEPPEILQRPRLVDPLLFRSAFWAVCSILTSLILVVYFGSRVPPFRPELAISEARLARILPPPTEAMKEKLADERAKAEIAEARRKRMEK